MDIRPDDWARMSWHAKAKYRNRVNTAAQQMRRKKAQVTARRAAKKRAAQEAGMLLMKINVFKAQDGWWVVKFGEHTATTGSAIAAWRFADQLSKGDNQWGR
jgi:uncharacterized membrane protein